MLPQSGPQPPHESRRERNKRTTYEAILTAAAELFTAHGYEAVTTQQIAQRADVSNGTFFRYAGTKADLLVTLMTQRVREGHRAGLALAREGAPPAKAILALLVPLADISMERPELGLAYQRELLFPAREDRVSSLDEVEDLQHTIESILRESVGADYPDDKVELAARAIYSTTYIELIRFAVGRVERAVIRERLFDIISALARQLLPPL